MSQALRQSELFAGADWQVLYRAFTDVNFNASDPPSINRALRAYIQTNYPENFNDWIESSEFVALIDLLSWLAGTLAFKTDLNARESFLETAETREAILRLARFISYNPRRNQCAQGIVKIVSVQTNDDVLDGFGTNLNGQAIQWDNPDDPDWFERFILVLNNAFIQTNQFGVPLKKGIVAGTPTQGYRLNNIMSDGNFGFTATVSGTAGNFEIVNPDFDDGGGFYEREPNGTNAFNLFYRNDGNGNSSSDTGFFMLFKQGTLQSQTFGISTPVENNVLDINVSNVNDSDVWVQTTNDSGDVLISWSKVPAIFNENITYNNYDPSIRNIFSVITRDTDQISLRFSDGRFGAVPVGNIRAYYRVSNGLQYQIRPADMSRVPLSIPYYNSAGIQKTLTLQFSLQTAISNSTPRETDDQIKQRAPSVYATQNRMVSGEDYNTFPLQSNLAVKLKALNRVYSGHSRFIDLNDPTGNYQDVNVFSDDGIFFKEPYSIYTEVPPALNASASDIVSLYMQPILDRIEVLNNANDYLLTQPQNSSATWIRAQTDASFGASGAFSIAALNDPYFAVGANIQFQPPAGATPIWATIADITGPITDTIPVGSAGTVTLSTSIPDGSTIIKIVPRFTPGLDGVISDSATALITTNTSFTLYFDYSVVGTTPWVLNPTSVSGTMFLVMSVTYVAGGLWSINAQGLRYVFESQQDVQWYNDGRRTTDADTGVLQSDIVRVLKVNPNLNNGGLALGRNYDLNIQRIYLNRDGSANPRRINVILADENLNGYPDDPDTFSLLISNNGAQTISNRLFWQHDDTYGDVPLLGTVVGFDRQVDRENATALPLGTIAYQVTGTTAPYNNTFWVQTSATGLLSGWQLQRIGTYSIGYGRGPNVAATWFTSGQTVGTVVPVPDALMFQWKHFAATDHRIDPARTNIHDMFVLTSEYDFLVRLWIAQGADPTQIPIPPTELDLRLAFEEFEDFRMFSDQLVWRPVRYKYLFGNGADDQLRASIKVVKLPTTTLSDGEVSSLVINAINTYFDSSLWDFGETFYYTPLAAYIHQQLANVIASAVLVPTYSDANFGDGFEIRCRSDEIFISTAQVADIQIIASNTTSQLRIR